MRRRESSWSRTASPALAVITLLAIACAPDPPPADAAQPMPQSPMLTVQESGTSALLQAVSVVDARVAWVSGHQGTYARTTNGGETWHAATVPGADTLQFRDVHAVDESTAYLLSAGEGELSRIYKTTDAGQSWTLQFMNDEPEAFFDCLDFWDARRGFAFSDAVDGEFVIIATEDGGESWRRVPPDRVIDARPGEAGFAASGTCAIAGPQGLGWIGTGASDSPRVLRTTDYGQSWTTASPVPIVAGDVAGVFSLAFRDTENGIALGGDLERAAQRTANVAITGDGGRSWSTGGRLRFGGPAYGGAYARAGANPVVIAVGPNGMDWSHDEGVTWRRLDDASYWAVGFGRDGVGWAVGPGGRTVRLSGF